MIDRATFAVGLGRLAVAARSALDDATIEVYFEALADETEAVQWDRFTRAAVKSGEFDGWLPKPHELIRALALDRRDRRPALPPAPRTPEMVAAQREEFQRGLATFRGELEKHGIYLERVGVSMRPASKKRRKS